METTLKHASFIDGFNFIQAEAHENAVDKGFWKGRQPSGDSRTRNELISFALDLSLIARRCEAARNGRDFPSPEQQSMRRKEMAEGILTQYTEGTVGKLALVGTELAEAIEGVCLGRLTDDKIPDFTPVEAEMADIIIRIMDLAGRNGWRVGEAIVAKMQYNAGREHMHGKNA